MDKQTKCDLLYLAIRLKETEDALENLTDIVLGFMHASNETSEFQNKEIFKLYHNLSKHKRSDEYHKRSLGETFKQLFDANEKLFEKRRGRNAKRNIL